VLYDLHLFVLASSIYITIVSALGQRLKMWIEKVDLRSYNIKSIKYKLQCIWKLVQTEIEVNDFILFENLQNCMVKLNEPTS
jgi:hypothetical protein